MIPLFDSKWRSLCGGYRTPYDPSKALSKLESGENSWDELWEELHHQGDVGEASYAAVPHLIRIAQEHKQGSWELYSFVATIEIERHRKSNPAIPDWLMTDYEAAIRNLQILAIADFLEASNPELIRSILGVMALSKRAIKLGALISFIDNSELDELVEKQLNWSELYKQQNSSLS